MDFAAVNSPATAFVAGLVTSLHCAGMCGPLACAVMPQRTGTDDGHPASTAYHLCRMASYSALGALAGGLGREPLSWVSHSALRWLPWVFVLFFVGLAFRWDRHLSRIGALGGPLLRLRGWLQGGSTLRAAAVLGLATPLLPCGPLYAVLALALLSGSALMGVEFMLAFGLGTVPLLWFVQSRFLWAGGHLSPQWTQRLRMALGLAAALVIAWRLRATLGLPGPDPASFVCCF